MEQPVQSVVDIFKHENWCIDDWQIQFLLSERHLHEIRKLSPVSNWYEDQAIATDCMNKLTVCFNSVYKFHKTFGCLPIIGDRLFDEDTGMKIQDRSIDGAQMTVTFILGS